ncbi:selenium metabolism-associated LysR family transcriptional regulator [Calderihabitans maritimus]|uniref:LysR family transcriptional regulator n=1 Tax=Calderihabitans maritimus TaxID=1246530 RepID=A0A1Z5HNW5_9FIRM|nr:selenium metabolism-associated LysR family transcriptional regulator [Calderihabitans maritimus]GAW91226.1 LysR family transcriptional regulator [Calderihabitans maritimus]
MLLTQLMAFCKVVQEGSISKAARELHLTQPALSAQIQALEEHFGLPLLERTNRGVIPTEAGEAVLYYAKRISILNQNLHQEIERLKNMDNEELAIGAGSTVGGYALPCSIYIFKEKYPRAQIKVTVANSEEIMQKLLDKTIDLGIVEGPTEKEENFISSVLAYDELLLVTPNNDDWKDKNTVTLEELKEFPFIAREEGSGTRRTIEKALQKKGLSFDDLNIVMELNSFDAIKASVEAGRGVTVLPRLAIKKEIYTGVLKALKVEGISFRHRFTAVYLPGRQQTLLQKKFLDFLKSKERGFC